MQYNSTMFRSAKYQLKGKAQFEPINKRKSAKEWGTNNQKTAKSI